jgi:branched-chain amino acid aminotransferase
VPPVGKGALYIRPLLIGSGPILGLAPAPEYMFLVFAAPVGNYFKGDLEPIHLVVGDGVHRAMPGGTGGVKTITNYAPVIKAQVDAKRRGFTDVLYLDAVHNRYLEEVSSCNVFVVKGGVVATPATRGTILPGITRKSVIELAADRGYKVHY